MIEIMELDILGTKYKVTLEDPEDNEIMRETGALGYMDGQGAKIVIADMAAHGKCQYLTAEEMKVEERNCLRHEIIHAFLYESGLDRNAAVPEGGWATHEEMVDFFAMQMPKMIEVFRKAGCMER